MSSRDRFARTLRRTVLTRVALGVVAMAALLTAAFVGVLGLVSPTPLAVGSRLPVYSLVMGIAFVVAILRLDDPERPGLTVLGGAAGLSVLAFVLVTLGTEGVFYTLARPDEVITSQLVFYFAAAGLICTGVVIWALHHWREFAADAPAP